MYSAVFIVFVVDGRDVPGTSCVVLDTTFDELVKHGVLKSVITDVSNMSDLDENAVPTLTPYPLIFVVGVVAIVAVVFVVVVASAAIPTVLDVAGTVYIPTDGVSTVLTNFPNELLNMIGVIFCDMDDDVRYRETSGILYTDVPYVSTVGKSSKRTYYAIKQKLYCYFIVSHLWFSSEKYIDSSGHALPAEKKVRMGHELMTHWFETACLLQLGQDEDYYIRLGNQLCSLIN